MAKFVAVSALTGSALAADLALTWTDCGDSSTHGKVTTVEPDTMTLGSTTTISGTGTVDEVITAGTFVISVVAGGGLVNTKWSGDLCSASSHTLPLGLGEIGFKGMACPVAAGATNLAMDVKLSGSIPASLAKADIQLDATATSGDKLLCMTIHTQSAYTYESWKAAYNKIYNGDDDESRKALWEAKDAEIVAVNKQDLPYKLGHNQFSASTKAEMRELLGFSKASKWDVPHVGTHVEIGEPAASVDWTTKGVVNPVKNQGQCGSCWAFSTVGAIESRSAIATGSLPNLAEQQFVDCDKVDSGCNGGLMDNGFKYAEGVGLCTESSYPYTATGGSCKASSCTVGLSQGSVTGYKDVATSSSALVSAIDQGPVSVAVEADQTAFQQYSSGVVTSGCGTSLDHGVIAVGYGTENGVDYFKVRNSWGASWGDNGYLKIGRSGNVCGITSSASYPTVSGSPSPVPPSPTPPTPPSPTPTPPSPTPTPSGSHYGAPPCQSDEISGSVSGGTVCAAPCSFASDCPTDVPPGASFPDPECMLSDSSGNSYCALSCGLLGGDCPTGSSCSGAFSGMCVWPANAITAVPLHVAKAGGVDCTTATCPADCTCALTNCADVIGTCLADATCAKGESCALACPCQDQVCALTCAQNSGSDLATPVAQCILSNCISEANHIVV